MALSQEAVKDAEKLEENNKFVSHIYEYKSGKIGICISKKASMTEVSQIIEIMNTYCDFDHITQYSDFDYHEYWFIPQ